MACPSCRETTIKKGVGYSNVNALNYPPLNSTDIMLYDGKETRPLSSEDWSLNRHKLLLFYPETFTPVCKSEMGALNDWVPFFAEQDCDVYSITADRIELVKQFYDQEETLKNSKYLALSSFILPTRIGIMNGNKVKRASVFITKAGELLIQEHFMKVGRSLKELHRTIYGYNQDSFCSEGWTDPSDGFLDDNN